MRCRKGRGIAPAGRGSRQAKGLVPRHVPADLGEIRLAGAGFVDQLAVEHHDKPVRQFEQLVEVLAGQRAAESGEVRVAGIAYHASREEMRRHKMSLLPEEPLKNACVGGMSVADNIAFREFDRSPFASGGWWLNRAAFRDDAETKIAQYKIKTRGPDTPIAALSGGNVQRAVLARELGGDVEVLIAANPCFGLDFAAVAQIHAEIMAARNRGAAVLLVSEDLDELLELSDRLVVMFHGQLVYEARASEADLTEIGRHMAGH